MSAGTDKLATVDQIHAYLRDLTDGQKVAVAASSLRSAEQMVRAATRMGDPLAPAIGLMIATAGSALNHLDVNAEPVPPEIVEKMTALLLTLCGGPS